MATRFTPLANPLLAFMAKDRSNTAVTAASLLTPINYNADVFADEPQFLSGNYGFEGYLGIPGLNGTDAQSQAIAALNNVAWESLDPALNAGMRAYTSAISAINALSVYGVPMLRADTMPLVFSHPVLPATLNNTDFEVTLSDGSRVTPEVAAFLPNLEYNERQTVVIAGSFGNRLQPGQPGALYPTSVRVVADDTPLELLGTEGLINAVGLTVESKNPYVTGNGPILVAAKLNRFSDLGEGGPQGMGGASLRNSGGNLYGTRAKYRLRLYTSAGFSPDGIAGLLPSDFSRYFILEARDDSGGVVSITQAGVPVPIGSFGTVTVVGLADLATAGTPENAAYIEDHDNYYDVILEGTARAMGRLSAVRMPSGDGYQAVYNPGGPGNAPDAPGAAPGPFTVASSALSIPISNDLSGARLATYIEVDGPVQRDSRNGQPIGRKLGVAVRDTLTGTTIWAYRDPNNRRFYASFEARGQARSRTLEPTSISALTPVPMGGESAMEQAPMAPWGAAMVWEPQGFAAAMAAGPAF